MKRFIRRPAEMAILATALCFCLFQNINAQDTVKIFLENKGWSGDTNVIEVRATHFREIIAFQLSFSEINRLGSFAEIEVHNLPGFTSNNYNYFPNFSTLTISYNIPLPTGISLPDGDLLFRIKWISQPLQAHCYTVTDAPTVMEFLNAKFESLPVRTYNSCSPVQVIPAFINVFQDENANCLFDQNEVIYPEFTVVDSFNGRKSILINPQFLFIPFSEYGNHYFSVVLNNQLWNNCSGIIHQTLDANTRLLSLNFGLQTKISCPDLDVELSLPLLRRCADNQYLVNYQNLGSQVENNAILRIVLDSFMTFSRASVTPSKIVGPVLEFNLGRLNPFQKGTILLNVHLDCNSTVTGQTHCVKAEMLPKVNCINSPNWSGAHLEVDAKCESGKVKFKILNSGQQNMSEPTQYWIVEDDIMPGLKKNIFLNQGASLDLEYPANGKTYRLCVDQVPFHPGNSNPSVALEGCGRNPQGDFSRGFVLQFPEDEEDHHTAVDCQQSVASYDPNDKMGWPIGYSNEQYIEADRQIDYRIRFQNTGTDTAFRVVVVDTLSRWFDLETFRITSSSHPFQMRLVDRVLTVVFDPIYLPYQGIDEYGSQGYLQYQVKPLASTPIKTRLLNAAEIFFDFNAAIKTNVTKHTISKDFILVYTDQFADPDQHHVNIHPNPSDGHFIVDCQGLKQNVMLSLINACGEICFRLPCQELPCQVNINSRLPDGLYLMNLQDQHGNISASKRIVIKNP